MLKRRLAVERRLALEEALVIPNDLFKGRKVYL
jgi:hypothetical protein